MSPIFGVALCHPDAQLPERKSEGAAGIDLQSCESITIPERSRSLISTGLKLQFTNDCYARIAPRSGLAVKGIDSGAGVVDSDYRGILKVLLINNTDLPYTVQKGDRIAQLIFEKIYNNKFLLVSEEELDITQRGEGGFGSTGK